MPFSYDNSGISILLTASVPGSGAMKEDKESSLVEWS